MRKLVTLTFFLFLLATSALFNTTLAQVPTGGSFGTPESGSWSSGLFRASLPERETIVCESCNRGPQQNYEEGLLPFGNGRDYGGLFFDAWVSAGATNNAFAPITTGATGGNGSLNSEQNNLQMNQTYLSFGREAVRKDGISFGAKVDLLYGTDYLYTSSLGLEVANTNRAGQKVDNIFAAKPKWNTNSQGGFPEYGLAMPQLYGEVYFPLLAGMSVKVGHMYSALGYESVMAPSNFFMTHSYIMQYGEAQTVTGVMIDQKVNRNWSFLLGVTEGWNVWDDPNDSVNITAGAKWQNDDASTTLSFVLMTGEEQVQTSGRTTNYALVYQQKFGERLTWVLQHDLGFAGEAASEILADGREKRLDGSWYSLSNYLFWKWTDTVTLGARFEWFRDKNHSRIMSQAVHVDSILPGWGHGFEGQDYFDLSFGVNWKPTNWITLRPEIRYDWSNVKYCYDNGTEILPGAYDNGSKKGLFTVGGDLILRF